MEHWPSTATTRRASCTPCPVCQKEHPKENNGLTPGRSRLWRLKTHPDDFFLATDQLARIVGLIQIRDELVDHLLSAPQEVPKKGRMVSQRDLVHHLVESFERVPGTHGVEGGAKVRCSRCDVGELDDEILQGDGLRGNSASLDFLPQMVFEGFDETHHVLWGDAAVHVRCETFREDGGAEERTVGERENRFGPTHLHRGQCVHLYIRDLAYLKVVGRCSFRLAFGCLYIWLMSYFGVEALSSESSSKPNLSTHCR